jgi:hypothetical protein
MCSTIKITLVIALQNHENFVKVILLTIQEDPAKMSISRVPESFVSEAWNRVYYVHSVA